MDSYVAYVEIGYLVAKLLPKLIAATAAGRALPSIRRPTMTSSDRITVSKTINTPKVNVVPNTATSNDQNKTHCKTAAVDNNSTKTLKLMMISCEENPPYGPSKETAVMFLELLCDAYEKKKCCHSSSSSFVPLSAMCNEIRELQEQRMTNYNNDNDHVTSFTISITIYHAQRNDYPLTSSEWSSYDGVIIPGSLSAAYDTHVDWIGKLQSVIRDKIHHMRLKTLGVCFGHQCFAHAFGTNTESSSSGGDEVGGRAIKCPSGSKAGRISSELTKEGRHLLFNICNDNSTESSMEMLYTHGDMVQSLPEFAISLGGNANVPIEACAYFSSREDKILFQQQLLNPITNNNGSDNNNGDGVKKLQPYAFTFQAHPEYISTTGFNVNYFNTVQAMQARGYISQQLSEEVCEDAKVNFDRVQEDSLNATIAVATALDWF